MAGMFDSDDELGGSASTKEPCRLTVLREDLPPHIGGRRGLFATQDIAAGTLIVLEWPTLTWDKSLLSLDDGVWTIIQQIVQHPVSHQLTRHLHPRQISDVPIEEFRQVEEKYREVAPTLMANLHSLVERDEILRLYLVLQHNGFQSGLYWHLCMINHSCAPNCIKFEPRTGSRGASEVWTTTNISAGEELLISYVSPLETSYPSAQEYLFSQHRFQCLCGRCLEAASCFKDLDFTISNSAATDATVAKNVPLDTGDADTDTSTVPTTLLKEVNNMEANFEGIEQMLHVATQTYRRPPDIEVIEESLETLDLIWAQITEYSMSSDESPTDDMKLCQQEVLRLQTRTQSIQSALLSGAIELFDGQKKHVGIARDYAQKLAVITCKLYLHQCRLFGTNHPNIATTLTDLSNALEFMIRLIAIDSSSEVSAEVNQIFEQCRIFLADQSWMSSLTAIHQQELLKRAGSDLRKQLIWKIKKETDRIKDLFMLAKRVPAAVKVLKGPGVVFWGMTNYS